MKRENMMDCITMLKHGGTENLIMTKVQIPIIDDDEVLIEVYVSGVNRPDILQRKGLYKPPKGASNTLGLEVSGKIIKIGKKRSTRKKDL